MPASRRLAAVTITLALLLPASYAAATEEPSAPEAASGSARASEQESAETRRERLARIALPAGLQVARKHATRPRVKVDGRRFPAPDPHRALVLDPTRVDYRYWRREAARKARPARDGRRGSDGRQPPTPFVHTELEPSGTAGANDTQAVAEQLSRFGTGAKKRRAVRILGDLAAPDGDGDRIRTPEDQGSIPLATQTGVPELREAVTVSSRIGNGPHGSQRSGSGDFDFFAVSAAAGETVFASTAGSRFDTVLVLYDAAGTIVDANDDFRDTLQSELATRVPAAGEYYLMVTGFLSLPEDPFDSASGLGAQKEGRYDLSLSVAAADSDFYAVRLRKGDVLGGTMQGGAGDLRVHRYDGRPRIGSEQDITFTYPTDSPLPGGGHASLAYVTERTGWYAVSTRVGAGPYRLLLEVYRPGSEQAGRRARQTVFLDFDGARVNTGNLGGFGVTTLSPLRSFLADWGLQRRDLDGVIDQIVATVKENIRDDLRARGLNPKVRVKVRNSRDHRDRFGRPRVSRVIVGGTIEESGIPTIGIAPSIDPGNFALEETALVLLDALSDPDVSEPYSLNAYLSPASDKVRFVGTAVGNIVAHEIGHYVGAYHVDQFDDTANLMDAGGAFATMFGVGPDGLGGTEDDLDVDFGEDVYHPGEGFSGLEETLNVTAWGFVLGR